MMTISRRTILGGGLAAPATLRLTALGGAATGGALLLLRVVLGVLSGTQRDRSVAASYALDVQAKCTEQDQCNSPGRKGLLQGSLVFQSSV